MVSRSLLLLTQPNTFLDRADEQEAIHQRLTASTSRLLTLTGPAGVGKTRLALAVAAQLADSFADGIMLVDLAPLRDSQFVLPTIARTLGVTESGTEPLTDRLQEYLRDRELLLILDTFEQVLPAARELVPLLAACPSLRMLVTSRVPLRLRWEQILRIAPLPVPDPETTHTFAELMAIPSVALFTERAQAQRADFTPTEEQAALLAQLVRQLDGLPLAIELAAAYTNVLSLAAIAQHLAQHIDSLHWDAQDVPDRHHSLRAAIAWSYELLPVAEQRLFRHLGVFVGRVSLDAIAAVVGDADEATVLAGMMALAEKSLVVPGRVDDEDPEPAFGLLETVRQYAREQLDAERALEAANHAHARYFLAMAERADRRIQGRDQLAWYSRLEQEHDNLRAALRWLLDHVSGEIDVQAEALCLVAALGHFWYRRGYYAEGGRWLEEALDRTVDAPPALRSRPLVWAGAILTMQGNLDQSRSMLAGALALARQSQDRTDIARALMQSGIHAALAGEPAESRRLLQESLRLGEELQDDYQTGTTLSFLGLQSFMQGKYQEAAAVLAETMTRFEAIGDMINATNVQFYLALALRQLGHLDRALEFVRTGLRQSMTFQDRVLLSRGVEATLLLVGERVDTTRRARLLGAGDSLIQATGSMPGVVGRVSGQSVASLRAQLEPLGLGAAYRAGRSLPRSGVVSVALALLDDFAETLRNPETIPASSHQTPPAPPENPLTEREQEVLRLVADGRTNRAIAAALFISPSTVNYHLTSIFNKLGVDTRAQAVAVATQRSLL